MSATARGGSGRLLRALALILVAGAMSAGCWGDAVPSRDQVGALRAEGDEVTIRFGVCPGEVVQRVAVNLADDDYEEILGVLWAVEAGGRGSAEEAFTVGRTPPGFREVTALEDALERGDHVQVVVTSSDQGTIPMSFEIGDLRSDEVLVRSSVYRSRAEFDEGVSERCDEG